MIDFWTLAHSYVSPYIENPFVSLVVSLCSSVSQCVFVVVRLRCQCVCFTCFSSLFCVSVSMSTCLRVSLRVSACLSACHPIPTPTPNLLNSPFLSPSCLLRLVCKSPWYNRTGWLGIKHQFTYFLESKPGCFVVIAMVVKDVYQSISLSILPIVQLHFGR